MKLIIGLGNPGADYAKTRHNFGFMVLDQLAADQGLTFCDISKWKAETAELVVHDQKVILIKPLTYMNLSGQTVAKFASYYKVEPEDIWLISDDLDLPLGRIRIRQGGSSGGHNGLKSVIECLGSDQFYRIRGGIAPAGPGREGESTLAEPEASIYVLQAFEEKEQRLLAEVVKKTAEVVMAGLTDRDLQSHTLEVGLSHP